MEKFIILLLIALLMLYILFTFPILGKTPDRIYTVTPKKCSSLSSPWTFKNFFVYKCDSINQATQIPYGRIIKEYYSENLNTIYEGNIFMKTYISGNVRIYGTPYIID